MRIIAPLIAGLIFSTGYSSAFAQGPREPEQSSTQAVAAETTSKTKTGMIIHLVDGRRMMVDEVRESAEGFWYRTSNLMSLLDKTRVKRIEQVLPEDNQRLAAKDTSLLSWNIKDSHKVETFFKKKFERSLPTTALGQSPLHTRWGLDHRQGIDVGLHPDSLEGRALIDFLRTEKIPFLAFRGAIPGVATGPHIHIGKGSHRTSPR